MTRIAIRIFEYRYIDMLRLIFHWHVTLLTVSRERKRALEFLRELSFLGSAENDVDARVGIDDAAHFADFKRKRRLKK